jgi:hypothetical protein
MEQITKESNLWSRRECADLLGIAESATWKESLAELRLKARAHVVGQHKEAVIETGVWVNKATSHYAIPHQAPNFPTVKCASVEAAEEYLVSCGKRMGRPIGGAVVTIVEETTMKREWT